MSTTEKWLLGTALTILSTELNSLSNNGGTTSTNSINNATGGTVDGFTLCDVELLTGGTVAAAYTANTGVSLWFLRAQDGTNYEDGAGGTAPARLPDVVLPLRNSTQAQRVNRTAVLPWGVTKAYAKNDGTGQTLPSSGNTIIIRPVTRQAQ